MPYDPLRHRRRSIRLADYDYAASGLYFVTIGTHGRVCLFGEVEGEAVRLNALGEIAASCWEALPDHFPAVVLDAFVVMPNHIHGLIGIAGGGPGTQAPTTGVEAQHAAPLPASGRRNVAARSLGAMVRSYKSAVTRSVNRRRGTPSAAVWQRNYYERIVRTDREADHIRRYIAENPLRWHLDRDPKATTVVSQA